MRLGERCARIGRLAAALVVLCAWAAPVQAQKLSIQGDRFAIDGTPRFLTFISYFGAMGAPNIPADFRFLRSMGFMEPVKVELP